MERSTATRDAENPVLVLSTKWPAYSEVWMERMNEMLMPDVVFATMQRKRHQVAHHLRTLDLVPPALQVFGHRSTQRLGRRVAARRLTQYLLAHPDTPVLCHYLTTALRFTDVWQTTAARLFVHCHGHDVTWDRRMARLPYLRVFPKHYPRQVVALSRKATLIANSLATREELLRIGVSDSSIRVKHLGVPVPEECPRRRPTGAETTVLYLGRFIDFKGPCETVQAFFRACEMGFAGRLVMAGDGPLRKKCQALCQRSRWGQRVEFLGAVSRQRGDQLRAEADVFTAHNCRGAISGQHEAYGVTIVEAMAAALPVVTGRSGGVVETVVEDETGILFEPGDIDAHAHAFLRLGSDPDLRWRLGRNGWRRALKNFSYDAERNNLKNILSVRRPSASSPQFSGLHGASHSRRLIHA